MDQPELEVERRGEDEWAVVDPDGSVLSVHPNESGAEAELTRLAQAEGDDGGGDRDADDVAAEDDPYTDNVGS